MKSVDKSKKLKCRKLDTSVNLPEDYPWQVLRKLTDDLGEYLQDDERQLLDLIIRLRDFSAYLQLSEDWGLQSLTTNCDDTLNLKARYILSSLLKKFQFDTDKALREETALKKFMAAESSCAAYNSVGHRALICSETETDATLFTYAKAFLSKLLGESLPSSQSLTEWSRHGPGANIDTCKGLVSSYNKFKNWPYSCTVDAYRYARYAIQSDERWFGALMSDYRDNCGIPQHYPIDMSVFWSKVLKVVDGNRICFVPKNALTERSIAIEPALNLYLQLGVDGYIRRRLKRFGIDLDDQTKNQRMAYQGSIKDGPRSLVTIDLSAASDSIAVKLCEVLLPPDWFSYLMDLSCRTGTVVNQDVISYEKISSMGNGFTFALESAIFASAIFAVQKFFLGNYDEKRCAVYGDDLIIEQYLAEPLVKLLGRFGFTINSEKSFVKGPIRESCGTDWFRGTSLRPVFLTSAPTKVQELFSDLNRLKRLLSLRFGVEEETKSFKLISKWIPEEFKNLKGPFSDEDFDSYIHCDSSKGHNYKECVWKYKRLVTKPRRISAENFLFRKIMHDLRPLRLPTQKWEKRLKDAGSRFDVTRRNDETSGYTYSPVSYWQDRYEEPKP